MTRAPCDDTAAARDVLVIGGGPAGATIATLLAEAGKTVTLIDKDQHPRFHIGESLLPFNLPLFERLGVLDQVERIGMPKYGIEFVSPDHPKPNHLAFSDGWHKTMDHAFQVRRADLDHLLIQNAARRGAEVCEGLRVTDVAFPDAGGVIARAEAADGSTRQWRGRFLVDASGRDTFMASRLKLKQRNPRHQSAALYGHFTGAQRLEGRAAGHISIFWFDRGWFWFIPLADGTTSVGAVCRPEVIKDRQGEDVTSFLQRLIQRCPALAARLRDAELTGPATATGNYSYASTRMAGDRYLMVGDASAFIDPVFSTGVYLAMDSAVKGAEAVITCLDQPALADAALRRFERDVRAGLQRFSWFIYRLTSPVIRNLFMARRDAFRIQEAVLALLAGDRAPHAPIRFRLALFKGLYYVKTALWKLNRLFAPSAATAVPVTRT